MEKKRGKRSKPMEDGVWDCSVCTFKNSAEAFKCAMCDVRKGTSTRKPKPNPQLVAQQVAQQLVTVPKKPALKRVAERVDLGSDTSQDSHRSETRDGEPGFSKASSSVQTVISHLTHQQAAATPSVLPSTSRCEASKPVDNQTRVTDFVTLGNRHHPQQQFGEPHNKSFSSVRQNNNHPSQSNGNGFAYPFFMDITVNGLTVRIEERDPKSVNPRQNSTQRTKRRKTHSNLNPAVGPTNANNAVQVSGRASDCSSLDGSVVSETNAERTSDRPTTETTVTHRADQAVTPPGEDAVGSLPPLQPPTSTSLQRQSEVMPEVCN